MRSMDGTGLPGGSEDPFDRVYAALMEDGQISQRDDRDLGTDAFTSEQFPEKTLEDAVERSAESKVHPLLQQWLSERSADETESLIITFPGTAAVPRFPEPEP